MDWYLIAKWDWEANQDTSRIQKYVEFGKITQEQADEIISV